MILIRKNFTQYDDTDELKRMKDSDILAEKEKKPSIGSLEIATRAGIGALGGAAVLGAANGIRKGTWKGAKNGAILGALAGGAALASNAIKKKNKELEEAEFYNKRLKYAQKQAKRREKQDWAQNMTQRDGYSY